MLPAAGRPLLEHVFDAAVDVVEEFVVVGYRGEDVIDTLGSEYRDTSISYVEQAQPKGTAHVIAQVREVVDDRFVVLNGDVLVDAPVLCALVDADGYAITTTTVSDPSSYGVVSVDADGDLEAIVEKPRDPPTNLANVGCYAFEPNVFKYIDRTEESERGEFEVTETLELLPVNERNVSVVEYNDRWLSVGPPGSCYMRTNCY